MADLNYSKQRTLESFISGYNGAGYVLDFTDKTFQDFVGNATGLDIADERYKQNRTSKANRLRSFCKAEND